MTSVLIFSLIPSTESYRVTLPMCLPEVPADYSPTSDFFATTSAEIITVIEAHFSVIPGEQTIRVLEFLYALLTQINNNSNVIL